MLAAVLRQHAARVPTRHQHIIVIDQQRRHTTALGCVDGKPYLDVQQLDVRLL